MTSSREIMPINCRSEVITGKLRILRLTINWRTRVKGIVGSTCTTASDVTTHQDGAPNFDCVTVVAPVGEKGKVTRPILRERLHQLFKDPADVALFHFSGHGTVNNLDGYLVTQDAKRYDEGVAMGEVLKLANELRWPLRLAPALPTGEARYFLARGTLAPSRSGLRLIHRGVRHGRSEKRRAARCLLATRDCYRTPFSIRHRRIHA